ncbi:hypothetical protein GIB67_006320 [Kingdonia uniflora]|uniref:Nop domain-containing protein n=1 Tax=Kingdonia uniflora TaxID=39325 RepID=A0A7J7P663_9MAGN|nr:hypothetical protein GIB67_006320 [Kingdonia uniflora]
MGIHIGEVTRVSWRTDEYISEILRGVRIHLECFIQDLKSMDVTKARFRLGNDYSCSQVAKVEVFDSMAIQAILLFDYIDKDVNSFPIKLGQSLFEIDLINIQRLAQRVVDLSKYKSRLQEYLQNKMNDIAPNLATLIGEVLCARLISHVGSLTNLAMCPAFILQILGG